MQIIVFICFFSLYSRTAPIPLSEEGQMLSSIWKLPNQFTEERLGSLLNKFTQETYLKAFRFIGVEEDFFHGHVLFERKLQEGQMLLLPRAILYHTQEDAHKAHWEKSIDSKYDYLNVTTRNWIQWLSDDENQDGIIIENARDYLDSSQKDPAPFFNENGEPQESNHYTIHAKNLDTNKLGFVLAGELQFEFYSNREASPYDRDRTLMVRLPDKNISLRLFTNSVYLQRGPSL